MASETEKALDELATLLESGGLGGGTRPTFSVLYRGPHTAGVLESFQLPRAGRLIHAAANEAAYIIISNGRLASSYGQGFHVGGSAIAFLHNVTEVSLGQVYGENDIVYLDSLANITANGFVMFVFEEL